MQLPSGLNEKADARALRLASHQDRRKALASSSTLFVQHFIGPLLELGKNTVEGCPLVLGEPAEKFLLPLQDGGITDCP